MLNRLGLPIHGLGSVLKKDGEIPRYKFSFSINTTNTRYILQRMFLLSHTTTVSVDKIYMVEIFCYHQSDGYNTKCYLTDRSGVIIGSVVFDKKIHPSIFQYIRLILMETC